MALSALAETIARFTQGAALGWYERRLWRLIHRAATGVIRLL